MFADPSQVLPIATLIRSRCNELGLSPPDLIRRAGFKNVSKGLRRLEQLRLGDFQGASALLAALPDALAVSAEVVNETVVETRLRIRQTNEDAWRAAFKPHAIIITDRPRPEPLFVAFSIGVEELIRVNFDLTKGPITFLTQALDGVQTKLNRWHSDKLPAFGLPIGVVVNYTPDHALRFDLAGDPIALLDTAYRFGDVALYIAGRSVTQEEFVAVIRSTNEEIKNRH